MKNASRLPLAPTEPSHEANEAEAELIELGRRRCGKIPPDLLARHVLALYGPAAWPVQRAAMEALTRRFGFAQRDGLRVAKRPVSGPSGLYATRRPRRDARPYTTLLHSLEPLSGSCDCRDFRRASLGLCKHLLVVLDDLAARPRKLREALEQEPAPVAKTRLAWNPLRPLHGAADWMERIILVPGSRSPSKASARERELRRCFAKQVGDGAVLRNAHRDDPARRLALVGELSEFLAAGKRRAETFDPALSARLAEERERLERVHVLRDAAPRLRNALKSLEQPLYLYQQEGVKRFLAEGRLLLADDMGLGKTAQAIAAGHALFRAGLVERGLLVVPASLKPQWLREWVSFSDAPIAAVDGSPPERAAAYRRQRRGFLVVNYEQVLRDLELMRAWRPDLVVLDEAQRIKNWAAKTSLSVKELSPPYRLVLTGTPMENRLEELASIFDWVDDHALEPKWRLVPFHAETADGSRALIGVRHLDALRARMAHCTVRRVRGDILKQLPPRTDTVIPVPLTPEQQDQHDELKRPIIALVSRAKRRPLTQAEFLRLMQLLNTQRILANGLAQLDFNSVWPSIQPRRASRRLLHSLFSPKLGELRELIQQLVLEQGRKVVVFSQWRRMLRLGHWAVGDLLSGAALEARFFTGAEGAKRRTENLVEFHDDEAVRVLFATDAGGVGLNLQRAANACVNLELPWNPAVLEQRVARIHRLGQTDPIDVYNLVGAGSIEERIASLVADKQQMFRGLFDGESDAVSFESAGSFLEGVGRLVEGQDSPPGPTTDAGDEDGDWDEDGDLEELVDAADETTDRADPGGSESSPAVPTDPAEVSQLFSQLEVERTAAGGLRIEAPPEAAAALAAMFQGMAALLSEATRR